MNGMDWSTPEYLGNIAAEELRGAFDRHGIGYISVHADEDGSVGVAFPDLRDAEAMMSLGVEASAATGTLYDRATGSCVALASLAQTGDDVSDEQIGAIIAAGWNWMIHPHMSGRRMGWHVSVDIPTDDANALTANLNTLALGGAV